MLNAERCAALWRLVGEPEPEYPRTWLVHPDAPQPFPYYHTEDSDNELEPVLKVDAVLIVSAEEALVLLLPAVKAARQKQADDIYAVSLFIGSWPLSTAWAYESEGLVVRYSIETGRYGALIAPTALELFDKTLKYLEANGTTARTD